MSVQDCLQQACDITEDNKNEAAASAMDSAASAMDSAASATDSASSAVASAASANFKGVWNSGTSYTVPSSIYFNGSYYNAILGSTNQNPETQPTYWLPQSPRLESGEYTPAATSLVNADTVAPNIARYTVFGNLVTIFGTVLINPTAAGTVEFKLSIPMASDFTTYTDASGTMQDNKDGNYRCVADATDTIQVSGTTSSTISDISAFNVSYVIK